MDELESNKQKLLALLKEEKKEEVVDVYEPSTPPPPETTKGNPAYSFKKSPTNSLPLNLFFWTVFLVFDFVIAAIIYLFWLT